MIQFTSHFTDVSPTIRLHSMQAGRADAPPMVLLHGFPEYWAAYKDVMPLLAQNYRVIAPDLRGFNLSSKPEGVRAYAAKHLVADILGLIQSQCGGVKPVLVAHDWGGAVAWNLAAQYPDAISHLVIVNSPHPYTFWRDLRDDPVQQAASAYMNWLRKPGCEAALADNHFARLESFFLNMNGASWFDPQTRAGYHAAWGQAGALTGGCNYYRASPLHPPEDGAPGAAGFVLDPTPFCVRIPTLILWGENDIALPIKLIEGLEPMIDDLTIQRFKDGSHWLLHEQPKNVSQTIQAWLQNRK